MEFNLLNFNYYFKNHYSSYFIILECKNSGEYSDETCVGWKNAGFCTQTYVEFMSDHCMETCGCWNADLPSENIIKQPLQAQNESFIISWCQIDKLVF